jgi:hypothetical protein
MIEKRKVPDADMEIIRNMDQQLESLVKMHHKVRKDFLRAEAVLLREHGTCERELKTFVVGLLKSFDVPEEDIKNWRLNVEEGEFTKEGEEPEAVPEPEAIEEPEPELSKEAKALQEIRKKYKR